jgi:hypothetical protein
VCRVEVGGLAGVHHRAAADRHIAVEAAIGGEARRLLQRPVGRFDRDIVVDDGVDTGGGQRRADLGDMRAGGEVRIGEQRDAAQAQFQCLVAGFGQDAGAERERRHAQREPAVAALGQGEVGVAAAHRGGLLVRISIIAEQRFGPGPGHRLPKRGF